MNLCLTGRLAAEYPISEGQTLSRLLTKRHMVFPRFGRYLTAWASIIEGAFPSATYTTTVLGEFRRGAGEFVCTWGRSVPEIAEIWAARTRRCVLVRQYEVDHRGRGWAACG